MRRGRRRGGRLLPFGGEGTFWRVLVDLLMENVFFGLLRDELASGKYLFVSQTRFDQVLQ